jgi:hypothetical protein
MFDECRPAEEWQAVERLPGTRIFHRQFNERGEEPTGVYLDEKSSVVASRTSNVLTRATGTYRFTRKGLETYENENHVLLMPNPKREFRAWFVNRSVRRIDMPDGRRLSFCLQRSKKFDRYAVATIVDEEGECLMTLRWKDDGRFPKDYGEAVISPHEPPVDRVLWAAYGFEIFDRTMPYPTPLQMPT